ncbi:unnamed protein product [Pleuronectes platessa]|uniref:Uncharacterized protein n=1 Tax=Pleuronectes platessa TaxID=8262 RepID=A0A9N7Z8J3_PLEPL|nr:unnamed protein product [Pleuronectes platessa]
MWRPLLVFPLMVFAVMLSGTGAKNVFVFDRAKEGLMDTWDQKAIRDLTAKKDLLDLMVYRVSRVYKGLRDPWGPQDAMELMEMMDLLESMGLSVLMENQVIQVCMDLRVNLGGQQIQYKGHLGHLGHLGGTENREPQVPVERLDHLGTLDQGAIVAFLAVQGPRDPRVKGAQVGSEDLKDQRGDQDHMDNRGHQVELGSFLLTYSNRLRSDYRETSVMASTPKEQRETKDSRVQKERQGGMGILVKDIRETLATKVSQGIQGPQEERVQREIEVLLVHRDM